jgi:hypothetical protein
MRAAQLRYSVSRCRARRPPAAPGGFKDLSTGAVARHLGMTNGRMTGHWCSRCHGIWFGYALEVECPQCGNRHG